MYEKIFKGQSFTTSYDKREVDDIRLQWFDGANITISIHCETKISSNNFFLFLNVTHLTMEWFRQC